MVNLSVLAQPKAALAARYARIRQRTLYQCEPLQPEDFVPQPVVDVSPAKWHLGHTTWFFERFVLSRFVINYQIYHVGFEYLFNSYYDGVGDRVRRDRRGFLTRPTTEEVYAYRAHVDAAMERFFNTDAVTTEAVSIIELGLQHEQQHQELLLTDLKYTLAQNPLLPTYRATDNPARDDAPAPLRFRTFEEGLYEVGFEGEGFCYDNELGRHRVFLEAFRLADRLVTNAEYLAFMEAGGYEDFKPWLGEGWEWVKAQSVRSPLYWHQRDGQWHEFTLGGLRPLDLAAPVTHVSYYEADAYARWRGLRLPTEFEWEVACQQWRPEPSENDRFADQPSPHPQPATPGNPQLWGDAWEWTASAYLPYPYYQPPAGPLGEYNGKFMVNQMVLRGGACATARDHIRRTYRNFFHPDKQWQFTGIRLAAYLSS